MSLAHICPGCGNQLARTRAVADAIYHLPIVVCGCGFAAVRRRHPLVARWRQARAAVWACVFLILQVLGLTGLSLANGGFISSLEQDVRVMRLAPWEFLVALIGGPGSKGRALRTWLHDDGGVVFMIGFAFASVAAGLWIRVSLAHWRWPRALLAWTLLVSMWVWFETLFWPLTWLDGVISGSHARYSGPGFERSIHMAELLGASLLVSAAATPIGKAIARGLSWSRRSRFIKKLNKRRKARRGE